jgi:hypothetical protein
LPLFDVVLKENTKQEKAEDAAQYDNCWEVFAVYSSKGFGFAV